MCVAFATQSTVFLLQQHKHTRTLVFLSLREVPASHYAEQAGVSLPRKGRQLPGAVACELWMALWAAWPAGLQPPRAPGPSALAC